MHPFHPTFTSRRPVCRRRISQAARAHLFRAPRHNRRILPAIRSAPRLSSDALITGVAGGNSARQRCLYRGNNNLRHRCRRARPGPLNPRTRAQKTGCRQKCIGGRGTIQGVPDHVAISRPIVSAGNFSAESARCRSTYLQFIFCNKFFAMF